MVRIGIIGMGNMGCTHFAAYERLAEARVVAFSARNPRRLAGDVSDLWGNLGHDRPTQLPMDRLRASPDPMDLIHDPDIDAIDICTPTPTHAPLINAAIRAGKHVLCEKPLCRTLAEIESLAAAMDRAPTPLVVMPAMVVRFMSAYTWLRAAVVDGQYGRVRAAHFTRLGSMPPGWFADGAASGGAWLDLHLHDVDIICWLFGQPQRVTSRGLHGPSGQIDHVHSQFDYNGVGPLISAEASWLMADGFPFRARFTVTFDHATADYDMTRTPPLLLYHEGHCITPDLDPIDGHQREIAHFVACIRHAATPTVTVTDALTAMRVLDAERMSVTSGAAVDLLSNSELAV